MSNDQVGQGAIIWSDPFLDHLLVRLNRPLLVLVESKTVWYRFGHISCNCQLHDTHEKFILLVSGVSLFTALKGIQP